MESRPASSVFRWAATGQEVGLRLRAGQRSARERGVSQVSPSAERMPLPPLSSPLLPSPPRYRWGGTELPMTCERSRPLARQRPWRPGAATGIQPSYRFASCGRAKPGDILFRYTVQCAGHGPCPGAHTGFLNGGARPSNWAPHAEGPPQKKEIRPTGLYVFRLV